MTPPLVRRPPARRSRLIAALLATFLGLAGGLLAAPAVQAGAVVSGATLERESALVAVRDGLQSTTVSLTLSPDRSASAGERRRPVVVVPVPADPTVSVLEGPSAAVFAELDAATAPRTVASETARQRGEDPPHVTRVPVVDYAVSELPAGDHGALTAWLRRHGATTSAAEARELRRYADAGWAFVALRLTAPVDGRASLRPLRLEFASDRLRFPLRVLGAGDAPVSVALYVAGPHRVTAKGFDTYHAGWAEDLWPTPNADVQALLGGEQFVTKLGMVDRPPSEVTGDLRTEQGVSDRLFRSSTDYPFESEAGFATSPLPPENAPEVPFEGPPGWLWLVLIPAVLVLVAVAGAAMRWRSARRRS